MPPRCVAKCESRHCATGYGCPAHSTHYPKYENIYHIPQWLGSTHLAPTNVLTPTHSHTCFGEHRTKMTLTCSSNPVSRWIYSRASRCFSPDQSRRDLLLLATSHDDIVSFSCKVPADFADCECAHSRIFFVPSFLDADIFFPVSRCLRCGYRPECLKNISLWITRGFLSLHVILMPVRSPNTWFSTGIIL